MGIEIIKDRIKELMHERPGITRLQLADEIGMSSKTVGKYVRQIKEEWQATTAKEQPK